jgi:hypothetical protein
MKKILFCFCLFFFALHSFCQNDSLSKRKVLNRFGLSIGLLFNTTQKQIPIYTNFYKPFNYHLVSQLHYFYSGEIPPDYINQFYKNSFYDFLFIPCVEFHYMNKHNLIHSMEYGYWQGQGGLTQVDIGTFKEKNFVIQYSLLQKLFSKKRWILHPLIGSDLLMSKKNIECGFNIFSWGPPPAQSSWDYVFEKSLFFIYRVNVGCQFQIKHIEISTNFSFNLAGLVIGKDSYTSKFKDETNTIKFQNFVSIDEFFSENYFLQNMNFKFGYNF